LSSELALTVTTPGLYLVFKGGESVVDCRYGQEDGNNPSSTAW
jgi:hypothetical protein